MPLLRLSRHRGQLWFFDDFELELDACLGSGTRQADISFDRDGKANGDFIQLGALGDHLGKPLDQSV